LSEPQTPVVKLQLSPDLAVEETGGFQMEGPGVL